MGLDALEGSLLEPSVTHETPGNDRRHETVTPRGKAQSDGHVHVDSMNISFHEVIAPSRQSEAMSITYIPQQHRLLQHLIFGPSSTATRNKNASSLQYRLYFGFVLINPSPLLRQQKEYLYDTRMTTPLTVTQRPLRLDACAASAICQPCKANSSTRRDIIQTRHTWRVE